MSGLIKRIIWGILLATFQINLFGIPVFPKIVGYGLWLYGIWNLTEERWTRWSGVCMTAVCAVNTVLGWLPAENWLWVYQMGAVLMAAEAVCGFCLMSELENGRIKQEAGLADTENGRSDREAGLAERLNSRKPEWYLLFSMAAIILYEYVIIAGGTTAGFWGAVSGIVARIILIVHLNDFRRECDGMQDNVAESESAL